MPDGTSFDGVRATAIRVLGSHIEELPGTNELQLGAVRTYKNRGFVCGWSVTVELADAVQEFHVLVPPHFPFSEVRIGIPNPPPFLTWPHVEKDGILCILDRNSSIDASDPIGVFQNLLARAVRLIENCRAGANAIDFETEFNTYWNYEVDAGENEIRSLVALSPGNRTVQIWDGKDFDIIANDETSVRRWLAHRYGKPDSAYSAYHTSDASLLWLQRPLHPSEYPRKAHDLRKVAGSAMDAIADSVNDSADQVTVILAAATPNGPALAAVSVPNPKFKNILKRDVDPLRRGFRPGHVPKTLLAERFLSSSAPVKRFRITRIDHEWIHGRGRDSRQITLKEASVAVIGCGSIGSAVAVSLAKAGVGTLKLIDNETLEWTNTSRHSLGAASVGLNKATTLARELQTNYPHLNISGHDKSGIEALNAELALSDCDVLVSATADWGTDQALSVWRGLNQEVSLVYGWTEAHACAGHAVLLDHSCCIECGYDSTGVPGFRVTEWPPEQTFHEPACGAPFQPYGPVEVGSTVTLVSGLVLDALLTPRTSAVHRFCVGPKSLLLSSGGWWSQQWVRHSEFRDAGNIVVEQNWPPNSRCTRCAAKA